MYPSAYVSLFPLSKSQLAKRVVEAYCGNVQEQNPLYTFMLEQMIEFDHFPEVDIPRKLDRSQAIRMVSKVCKAWMIEYIYFSQFAQARVPEDNYYLE
jgi:hypothetical protein